MHKLGEGLGGWTTRFFTLSYEPLNVTLTVTVTVTVTVILLVSFTLSSVPPPLYVSFSLS